MRTVLLLLACLLTPMAASATPIALASATLDWSHWSVIVSDGLEITNVIPAGIPAINTATATPSYTSDAGMAQASASAIDGLLETSAKAAATDTSNNLAQASTMTMIDFWFYGSGYGQLTVSIPYTVETTCSPGAFNESSSATAGVWLEDGPGVRPNGYQSATFDCEYGSAYSGMLTVSRDMNNPTWGPLVDFAAGTNVMATANVPDSGSTLGLLALGICGLGMCVKYGQ